MDCEHSWANRDSGVTPRESFAHPTRDTRVIDSLDLEPNQAPIYRLIDLLPIVPK